MKVAERMQQQPVTVTRQATVGEVARAMCDNNTRHTVVVDANDKPVGIVTATDLIAKHAKVHLPTYFSLLGYSFPVESRRDDREIERALATTAADLMTADLVSIGPDTDIDDAATLMLDRGISCLTVVNHGRLLGTFDETDIVRLLVVEEA